MLRMSCIVVHISSAKQTKHKYLKQVGFLTRPVFVLYFIDITSQAYQNKFFKCVISGGFESITLIPSILHALNFTSVCAI